MLTPEQRAAGWREHDGAFCRLPMHTKVSVMLADGRIFLSQADHGPDAEYWEKGWGRRSVVSAWKWKVPTRRAPCIVAYRPEDTSHDQ